MSTNGPLNLFFSIFQITKVIAVGLLGHPFGEPQNGGASSLTPPFSSEQATNPHRTEEERATNPFAFAYCVGTMVLQQKQLLAATCPLELMA